MGMNSFGLEEEKRVALERDIAAAFNRVSFENLSNTPDYILASVAVEAALTFSREVLRRDAKVTMFHGGESRLR